MALKILQKLQRELQKFPSIGEKLGRKLAIYIITRDKEDNDKLIEYLKEIETNVYTCEECNAIVENGNICAFCKDDNRENKILVIQNIEDYLLLSENNLFNGYYHILGGLISPLRGITPDKLSIEKLISRIEKRKIEEIIFALPETNDGLITMIYIKNLIKEKFNALKFSKIAQGIPMGSNLMDISLQTISNSIKNREEIKGR